ncbi:ergothioneine biosynthesis glutamate--cysteine ligase EgtA [Micromonospora sp. CP22]|uniref:ergothioneine biosynthesis glutamate--cysteine ligase EgtA n=1 Tax=Micromonospora sp. CP22 TaxID=2580517 RepID=UPI00132282DB|nr:ergothioneine biosynthesis glutamate--cysteine ligase EgtA [Micromonospora sp. CP22]MTK04073.1 ergothioneine biosynthesis glutamate--cysteine ligase EgtA [Micromonospora sp. CP22]
MVMSPEVERIPVLRDRAAAARHLARICFKTGPPTLTGVELEWTVHDAADPTRPVDAARLRAALGPYAPTTLDPTSPALLLLRGGAMTVEPGGQLEISTPPHTRIAALIEATRSDAAQATRLLSAAGLTLGQAGIDPYRHPQPVIDTPRYRAMRHAFDRHGPHGRTMMYSTAGLQICLDAGQPDQLPARWRLAHTAGPPLLAAFATADRHAGRPTGWTSARMAAWWRIDPARTAPVWTPAQADRDPVAAWTAYVLAAPLLCVREAGPDWTAPPDVTFADWLDGALHRPPRVDDLEYHVSTLFPPVRPRGYLEIRYLDAQPGTDWILPLAMLSALFSDPDTTSAALDVTAPVADAWHRATRYGLRDVTLARAATGLFDLARGALPRLDLPPSLHQEIDHGLRRRRDAAERSQR